MWVVFMDADGACWTVPNPEKRMSANWTLGPAAETGRLKTTRNASVLPSR